MTDSNEAQNDFSPVFFNAVGKQNLHIFTALTDKDKTEIQRSVLNHRLWLHNGCSHLEWLPAQWVRHSKPGWLLSIENSSMIKRERLYTQVHAEKKGKTERASVETLAPKHNCTLAELFGDSPANKPSSRSNPLIMVEYGWKTPLQSHYPETIIIGTEEYKSSKILEQFTPQGNLIGGFVPYSAENGNSFLLPVYVDLFNPGHLFSWCLKVGLFTGDFFYGAELLEDNQAATVLLCENILVADQLNKNIKRHSKLEDFIAVSSYTFPTKNCFKELQFRKVILILNPTKEHYKNIDEWYKLIKESKAKSVFVLKGVPCPISIPRDVTNDLTTPDPFERSLLENINDLSDMTIEAIQEIAENAISYNDYKRWGHSVGLFTEYLPEGNLKALFAKSNNQQDSTSYTFGALQSPVLIHGTRNVGKSLFALTIGAALAAKDRSFIFEADEAKRVLLIDTETRGDIFASRLLQLGVSESTNNFRPILLKDSTGYRLDLAAQEGRMQLEHIIGSEGYQFVIIDNLTTLVPKIRSSPRAWTDFFLWILSLEQKFRVTAVLVHHSNVDGKAAGSSMIEDQCRTVIHLEGRPDLVKKAERTTFEQNFINSYQDQVGTMLKVSFTKNNMYPQLERNPFGAFLPLNKAMHVKAAWTIIPLTSTEVSNSLPDYSGYDLSVDAQAILRQAQCKEWFARRDVEKWLSCGKNKAATILKALCDEQLLDRGGIVKSTKYRLRQAD